MYHIKHLDQMFQDTLLSTFLHNALLLFFSYININIKPALKYYFTAL